LVFLAKVASVFSRLVKRRTKLNPIKFKHSLPTFQKLAKNYERGMLKEILAKEAVRESQGASLPLLDARSSAIEKRICSFVAPGHSYESACLAVGINRTTLQIGGREAWKTRHGRYGKFVEKLDTARNRAKIRLVNFLANNRDWKARWKLLKNYWLQEFSERILTEVSGPAEHRSRWKQKATARTCLQSAVRMIRS
jgi:hypothetical protein